MSAKISIIMPVYKVEEYVGKSIESMQNQTYENWELFAVDDGSPDKSGDVCEEYAKKVLRRRALPGALSADSYSGFPSP